MKSFVEINRVVDGFVISLDSRASYSLGRIKHLLEELGNPQEEFKTVHIAGTSGKSSTAYFTATMLEEAGYKVGLSVSPYVEQVNERVQLGTKPLPEPVFCREFTEFFKILNTLSIKPTYFELFVSFAYWYFAKIKVDYAVIEVGLGGLLDGTNVIERHDKVCVITDIGMDHTRILGKTLAEIARQKAGIIQDHNHILMYRQDEPVDREIVSRAREKHAALQYVSPGRVEADLPDFQKRNWLLAKNVCEYICQRDSRGNLSDEQWAKTTKLAIPGRLEIFGYKDKKIILDGAHNVQKVRSLITSFRAKFSGVSPVILLAIGDNKADHLDDMSRDLSGLAGFTIITRFSKGRDVPRVSIDPGQIAKNFPKGKYLIEPDLSKAVRAVLKREEDLVLITGSLYLIGSVKKVLRELL